MSRMSDDVKAALLDKTLEQLDYVVDISEMEFSHCIAYATARHRGIRTST